LGTKCPYNIVGKITESTFLWSYIFVEGGDKRKYQNGVATDV
jgi:hypothetical protein